VTLAQDVDRDVLVESMALEGIPCRVYFLPLHLQPYLRERFDTREGMLPVTEDVAARTLALPFHNNLREEQVDRVVNAMRRAVRTR
jgi:perosamine synthetase